MGACLGPRGGAGGGAPAGSHWHPPLKHQKETYICGVNVAWYPPHIIPPMVLYLRYYELCVFIPVEIFLPAAAQAAGRKTQNRTISDSQITRASLHMRLRVDGFKL